MDMERQPFFVQFSKGLLVEGQYFFGHKELIKILSKNTLMLVQMMENTKKYLI